MIIKHCKIITQALMFVVVFILTGLGPVAAGVDTSVTVKSQVEVKGDDVTLGDVAVIDGPDSALKNDLSSIFITKAPRPGESTTIRRPYLEFRIKASGLPLNMVAWDLQDKTTVSRQFQTVDEGWVRTVVEEHLAGRPPYQDQDWELLSLKTGSLPRLPEGELTFRIADNYTSSPTRVVLNLYLSVDGKEAGVIKATGEIDLFVSAVVAAKRLENGQSVQPDDLTMAKVSVSRLQKGALTTIEQAQGMSCRRHIQVGQPVLEGDLVRANIVERGSMVTIIAESGPMKVTAPGEAKRSGALGDNISVLNLSSKKLVTAQVVSSDTVQVNF
jgi:flagella basal body P-ring formation protein FlgA